MAAENGRKKAIMLGIENGYAIGDIVMWSVSENAEWCI